MKKKDEKRKKNKKKKKKVWDTPSTHQRGEDEALHERRIPEKGFFLLGKCRKQNKETLKRCSREGGQADECQQPAEDGRRRNRIAGRAHSQATISVTTTVHHSRMPIWSTSTWNFFRSSWPTVVSKEAYYIF